MSKWEVGLRGDPRVLGDAWWDWEVSGLSSSRGYDSRPPLSLMSIFLPSCLSPVLPCLHAPSTCLSPPPLLPPATVPSQCPSRSPPSMQPGDGDPQAQG